MTTWPSATPTGTRRSTTCSACHGRLHPDRPARRRAPRAAYACDITYGTSKEFGFDFLRDELKRLQIGNNDRKTFEEAFLGKLGPVGGDPPVQRGHFFAVVDEADSILIDEARTPLIIGANNQPTQEEAAAYLGADQLAATLVRIKDFKYDPAERKAELNASGRRKVQVARPATRRSRR